jgi:phosphoglycolate phosphatase
MAGRSASNWPEAVVFDLDGTLVDSAPDIAASLNAAITGDGLEPVTLEEVRSIIGAGVQVSLGRAVRLRSGGEVDDARLGRLYAAFLEHAMAEPAAKSQTYPGTIVVLERLKAAGVKLAVCTNKPQALTERVLADMGLARFFPVAIGASETRPRKPHAAMLEAALGALGVSPRRSVMVGDSDSDVGSARSAGVPVVLMSYGYSSLPALALGADAVVDDMDQLLDVLGSLGPTVIEAR